MVSKELKLRFNQVMSGLYGKEYVMSLIAYGIAPTIRGSKPSSILTLKKDRKNTYAIWHEYKKEICKELHIEYYELASREDGEIVMFFESRSLEGHLKEHENAEFLQPLEYDKESPLSEKLNLLKKRYAYHCPHEMGIFLGIPVEDVNGFLECKGRKCLMCRYWKVYHNLDRAKQLFENFDCARKIIIGEVVNRYCAA